LWIRIDAIRKKITKKCIFPLKFLNFLAPGSGIRIPNTDPDPQSH
jgi:hypothetical protein